MATLFSNFDVSTVQFGETTKNKYGGPMVYYKQPVYIETPVLSAPFGLSCFEDDSGNKKYSLDLSFKNIEEDETVQSFHASLQELDRHIIKMIQERREEFFSGFSDEVIEAVFKSCLKPSDKYPDNLKVKVPCYDGEFPSDLGVFNEQRERIALSDIPKGARVRAIIELKPLWFIKPSWGFTWCLKQLICYSSGGNGLKTFAFSS
jgi:hypothetical protein